jgi:hypothetical protein
MDAVPGMMKIASIVARTQVPVPQRRRPSVMVNGGFHTGFISDLIIP